MAKMIIKTRGSRTITPQPEIEKEYVKTTKPRAGIDPDRRFDKTQLHEAHHGQTIHRDYAAHFFRWGFAGNFSGKGTRILEIGCGQDQPLLRVLQGSINLVPDSYIGVDLNKIKAKRSSKWGEIKDEFNFVDDGLELAKIAGKAGFNLVVSFEVIEHMRKEDGFKLLVNARKLMSDDGLFILSTPVYNGKKMAANHIHEYEIQELQDHIEKAGFRVVNRFGTFASWNDIKKACIKEELALLTQLREYYSWDVLSCFLAPKYPNASRNNVWLLEKA